MPNLPCHLLTKKNKLTLNLSRFNINYMCKLKNNNIETIVLITDLRIFTLACVAQISRESRNSLCVISERTLHNNDYGQYSSSVYKKIKIFVFGLLVNTRIVKENELYNKEDGFMSDNQGVRSSLISITKDSDATKEKYKHVNEQLKQLAIGSKEVFEYIEKNNPDRVFLFNGRFSGVRYAADEIKKTGKEVYYYEWGATPFHFVLRKTGVHDFKSHAKITIAAYEQGIVFPGLITLKEKAESFSREKLNNEFSVKMKEDVSEQFDVSIFLGSPHEYMALTETDSLSAIDFCRKVVEKYGSLKYAIRAHPNQMTDPSWRVESEMIEEYANTIDAKYFPPDSKINSYSIIDKSNVVAVLHSSIAIDAFFLGATVDVFIENTFKLFIDYSLKKKDINEQKKVLSELCIMSLYMHQYPLHPRLIMLMKMLNWMDYKFAKNTDMYDSVGYSEWYNN